MVTTVFDCERFVAMLCPLNNVTARGGFSSTSYITWRGRAFSTRQSIHIFTKKF